MESRDLDRREGRTDNRSGLPWQAHNMEASSGREVQPGQSNACAVVMTCVGIEGQHVARAISKGALPHIAFNKGGLGGDRSSESLVQGVHSSLHVLSEGWWGLYKSMYCAGVHTDTVQM